MDRIDSYRHIMREVIREFQEATPEDDAIETLAILDDTSSNYLLTEVGWQPPRRVYSVIIHLRLKDNRIWIEQDWTEEGVARRLLRAGIDAADIELGFQSPDVRPYSELATLMVQPAHT
jgi:hypothetical protein